MTRARRHEPRRLSDAALAVLPQLLDEWLPGGKHNGDLYIALNPTREDRHLGSFQINVRSGRWRDHAIGFGGTDVASLLCYLLGVDYRAAQTRLAGHPIVAGAIASGAAPLAAKPAKAANPRDERAAVARRIYEQAGDIRGTPAEAYLEGRALKPSTAWASLRTSLQPYPRRGWQHALIAPIRALDGSLVGLHRTYLRADGRKLDADPVRLTLGSVRGAAIRLGEPDDRLIICEGLEDGLTLFQELSGSPVWVSAGAALMAAMAVPGCVRHLTIAADNDPTGEAAAIKAADALSSNVREISIARPSPEFKDFNDQLREVIHAR